MQIDNVGSQGIYSSLGSTLHLENIMISNTGAEGIFINNSSLVLSNSTISISGTDGFRATNGSTAQVDNIMITNVDRDGVRVIDSSLDLNNSSVSEIGNGGAGDDAFHLTNSTLSGVNNSIQVAINNGMACCQSGGAKTGNLEFSSGPIISCP